MNHSFKILTSKKLNSYCTPPEIIKLVVKILGRIDLDPCSNPYSMIISKRKFTELDGEKTFISKWIGKKIFINPPFSPSKLQDKFIEKAINESKNKEILILVPCRTETIRWQKNIFKKCDAICFLNKRIKFFIKFKRKKNAVGSMALCYLGKRPKRFKKITEPQWGKTFLLNNN